MIITDSTVFGGYVDACNNKAYLVPVSIACNARCVFCATTTYSPITNVSLIDTDLALATIDSLICHRVRRVEITGGGEPSLHPQLGELIRLIKTHAGQCVVKVYTNGKKLEHLHQADEVNVSRLVWDADDNQRGMHITGGSPDLLKVSSYLRDHGVRRLRLSVPILKGFIDNLDAAEKLVEESVGHFDAIVLRPLYPATPRREMLHDQRSPEWWSEGLAGLREAYGEDIELEFDEVGCFRSEQLIVGADLSAYSDWSLKTHAPGTR